MESKRQPLMRENKDQQLRNIKNQNQDNKDVKGNNNNSQNQNRKFTDRPLLQKEMDHHLKKFKERISKVTI